MTGGILGEGKKKKNNPNKRTLPVDEDVDSSEVLAAALQASEIYSHPIRVFKNPTEGASSSQV